MNSYILAIRKTPTIMKSIVVICLACFTFTVSGQIVINEIVASNVSTASDQDGEFDDWIELYNNNDNDVDLSGYFMSDNPENHGKWEFPAGTIIEGKGYLIIWADEDGGQDGLHCSFKLAKMGESLSLSRTDTIPFETLEFGEQEINKGFARRPNGTGSFMQQTATFNANNDTASNNDLSQSESIQITPNPVQERVTLDRKTRNEKFYISTAEGRVVQSGKLDGNSCDVSSLQSGIYFITINGQAIRFVKQ